MRRVGMCPVIVAMTTIRQGSELDLIERVRAVVALDTCRLLAEHQIPTVVVYAETEPMYLQVMKSYGSHLVQQKIYGMGAARREAFTSSLKIFPEADYFFWLEPEKPDMVRFVWPMA